MRKISLLLLFFVLFVSCVSYKSNKLYGYDSQIKGNLSVYIAVAIDNKQKLKWIDNFEKKLTQALAARGVSPEIITFKTDTRTGVHDFKADDITTINPNGLILLITEDVLTTYNIGVSESQFSVRLKDNNLGKDVWVTDVKASFGNIVGGMGVSAGATCKELIKTMEKDELLRKK